jgi:photosystem II stability/assembly factor-like uncharacterized protein
MKNLLLVVLALQTTIMVHAQQWTTLNPYPTNKSIHAVAFATENTGFIAGDNSTFMRTTDGGETWEHIPYPVPHVQLTSLKFRNEMHGALVSWSHIYITHDGGETWNYTQNQLMGDYLDSFFLNDSVGWLSGTYQILVKTEDGGQTWTTYSNSTNISQHYKVIEFANEQTGYIAGYRWSFIDPVLKRTDDGGITWQELPIPEGVESITGMSVLGTENLWIAAENGIFNPDLPGPMAVAFHSTDGGQTWTAHTLGEHHSTGVIKIKFFDEISGYAITHSNLFITNDGGQSWESIMIPNTMFASFSDISITENQSVYVSSRTPGLWKSTDGGNNWENKFDGEIGYFSDIMFVDDNLGYVSGYDIWNNYVLKTEDGGQNWQESYTEQRTNANRIIKLEITDLGHITTATNDRRIIKSTDQGTNWEVLDVATDVSINSLTVPSDEAIFVGSSVGNILKSTNGGESWTEINSPIVSGYTLTKNLHFLDGLNGFAVLGNQSNQGKLFSTSDGGQTWVELHYGYENSIRGISFHNPSMGIVNVTDIGLLKTLDGGQSWNIIYQNPAISITYAKAFDDQTFLATNLNNLVMVTNNGGETWHTAFESYPNSDQIFSMFFLNPGKGWLTGSGSLIQVYYDPLMAIQEKAPLPTAQNAYIYPNPATDQITINCDNCLAIRFYAPNGSLVKEIQRPQSNHIQGLKLAAGIYIVELFSGTEVFRQRLVIKPY